MNDYNSNYSGQNQPLEDQIAEYQLHQQRLEQERARLEGRLRTQSDGAYADPTPAASAPADVRQSEAFLQQRVSSLLAENKRLEDQIHAGEQHRGHAQGELFESVEMTL